MKDANTSVNPDREDPPLCACNCGLPVERSKVNRKWNRYIHGHNSRSSSNDAKFKPGNMFGKGRAEGSRNRVSISAMNLLKGEEEALSRRAIESALNGNVQMLQFCLSRILPPPPKDESVTLDGMPKCTDMKSAQALSSYVLDRLASGELTPTQANVVSGIVERHIRCLQVTDLEQRLAIIEEALAKKIQ
jgi:hypothetical protein